MNEYIIWYITKKGYKDYDYISAETEDKALKEFMSPWMRRNLDCILSIEIKETA